VKCQSRQRPDAQPFQRERDDGTVVHGYASGEWTLNEDGDLDDIAFFASPLWIRTREI
jgi:hypothetical protein